MVWCRAHPRLRGADARTATDANYAAGSSPLTRGGQPTIDTHGVGIRLIPAYAGRTLSIAAEVGLDGAHPRLRGADGLARIRDVIVEGSSPLTRGGLPIQDHAGIQAGLIPAYAGRTSSHHIPWHCSRAHPRLRGADRLMIGDSSPGIGSSPLTRGGLAAVYRRGTWIRLIPAYAGRTLTDQRGRAKNEASRSDLWCNGQCRRAFRAALQPVRR